MLTFFKNMFTKNHSSERKRSFVAANNSRLMDWVLSYNKINRDLKNDYISMTLRARDLARNNEFIIAYLENAERNIIGQNGFTLQSNAASAEDRTAIERLWREYQSRAGKYVTLDEHQSGRDLDVLILRTLLIDGEVFIRKVYDPESKFTYRYEVLDSLEIDPLYNVEDYGNGECVTMGIHYDARGREVGYFHRASNADVYMSGPLQELSADEVIHVYRKLFPDQARGITAFSGIIVNLHQMDDYKEAELVHARVQAMVMGIWERNGQAIGDPLEEEATPDGETTQVIKTGQFSYAPKGYTPKFLQNTSPNNQFGIFWKNMLRSIANALGISYNKAAGDYESVNYSSLREATLEDRASFEKMQRFLIENWKDFQFEAFIQTIALNEFIPFHHLSDCLVHKFFGKKFPWVDPVKELAAKEKEFDLLLTDPITELESRGIDVDEMLARWQDWHNKLAERRLPFMTKPAMILLPEEQQTVAKSNQETYE